MTRSRRDNSTSSRKSRREAPTEADDLKVLEELSEDEDLESIEELEELDELTDDDELESLEELEELEELLEDDGVEITLADATEDQFDVRLTIAVGDMDRSKITGSIEAPLRQKAEQVADELRWKRVVVTFTGEAMIPSLAKELVGDVVPDAKPLSVTVQRGYPDEVVHEGKLPTLEVDTISTGNDVRVDIDTGDIDSDDLASVLEPELDKICANASGKAITFCFTGGTTPAPDSLRAPLAAAGATRVVLKTDGSEDVLFDREIEELVSITSVANTTVVEVGAGKDTGATVKVLTATVEAQKDEISGKDVRVNFGSGSARGEEIECLIKMAAKFRPATLVVGDGDQLWPALLRVASKDRRTALKMVPGDRKDIASALRRELGSLKVEGQELTFDWPARMAIDGALQEILVAAKPASLSYSFDGENREPIWPSPMSFSTEGDTTTCELNSEAGKPVELVRALQRHVPAQCLTGKKVDVQIQGEGMISRTMRQTIVELLENAGATQARLIEHGNTDYLFPKLLSFETVGEGEVRITVTPGDRSEAEVTATAASELAEREIGDGSTVRIPGTPEATPIVESVIDAGASRVILEGDGTLQIHPPLFSDVEHTGDDLSITASPDAPPDALLTQVAHELPVILEVQGSLTATSVTLTWHGEGDPARARTLDQLLEAGPAVLRLDDGGGKVVQLHPGIVRTFVDILGRRDAAQTPITILGVDSDDAEGVVGALEKLAEDIEGRRVMVVFREDGREVTGAADNAAVQATHAFLEPRAKAILVYRQATRQTPAHFEVAASNLDGLVVGAKMRDPRG